MNSIDHSYCSATKKHKKGRAMLSDSDEEKEDAEDFEIDSEAGVQSDNDVDEVLIFLTLSLLSCVDS